MKDTINTLNLFENDFDVEKARALLNGTKCHATIVQKGGTGKTTITSNICYTLAQKGFKVLAIDSDSQASLTDLCNLLPEEYFGNEDFHIKSLATLYDKYVERLDEENRGYFTWDEIKEYIVRPTYNKLTTKTVKGDSGNSSKEYVKEPVEFGFDMIPSDIDLANSEIDLAVRGKVYALFQMIQVIRENADYDFIIIDCPPGLGTLAYNAVAAATDGCLVPVNLECMTIRGARNLIKTVAEIQKYMWAMNKNPILHKGIAGIIKNQYVPRLKTQRSLAETVDTLFPIPSFETSIPNKATCDKAHMIGQLYCQFDKKAKETFEQLCSEIVYEDIRRAGEQEPIVFEEFGSAFNIKSKSLDEVIGGE